MDRRRLRRWGMVALLVAAFFAMRQCQLGYARVLPVHVQVLTYTASKLCTLITSGRGMSAEGIAEYVYPARRGRDFLARYAAYRDRPSYAKFAQLLDDYEAFVHDADAGRAAGSDLKTRQAEFAARCDLLSAAGNEIRDDLKHE